MVNFIDLQRNLLLLYANISSKIVFAGNSNLVYTIIRKRHVFHALANLPSDVHGISKCLSNRKIAVVQPAREPHSAVLAAATVKARQAAAAAATAAASKALQNGARRDITEITDDEDEPNARQPKLSDDDETHSDAKSDIEESMEGSRPALPAEPGTLKASLLETPAISTMTERESAHPLQPMLSEFSPMTENCNTNKVQEVSDTEFTKLSLKENDDDDTKAAPLKRTVNQV